LSREAVTPVKRTSGDAASAAMDNAEAFLGRFVCFPSEPARVAATLWVAHTYLLERFDSTPRLAFLSPEPGSGKTRALEVIGSMVRRPIHAVHATPSALFRAVGDVEHRPTILFDEVDTVFGPKARDNEEIRGFLNAGHRRSGTALRCVGMGTQQRVVEFPSFAAVALAGLHDLPGTIAHNGLTIHGIGDRVHPVSVSKLHGTDPGENSAIFKDVEPRADFTRGSANHGACSTAAGAWASCWFGRWGPP